jgi:anti-anti-sigma factor
LAITLEHREEASVVRLEGIIDIALAAEFKQTLLEALTGSKPVLVALDSCKEMDVTAVQLLWAAEREARSLNLGFTLEGEVPDSISGSLKESGFEKFPVPV